LKAKQSKDTYVCICINKKQSRRILLRCHWRNKQRNETNKILSITEVTYCCNRTAIWIYF